MDLPARYPYDPSRKMVAVAWASGAFGLAIAVLVRAFATDLHARFAADLWTLGIVGSAVGFPCGLLLTIRRYAFPRFLVLDEYGVWIPSGFMRAKPRRVVFAEVSDVWEAFLPRCVVLCLRCHGKTFEIFSLFLADHQTYLAVGEYIWSRIEVVARHVRHRA